MVNFFYSVFSPPFFYLTLIRLDEVYFAQKCFLVRIHYTPQIYPPNEVYNFGGNKKKIELLSTLIEMGKLNSINGQERPIS